MTVDEAIALWPELEKTGLRLGSPAAVKSTGDWMVEFMQKVKDKNLRVDFVTIHWYAPPNADSFIKKVTDTYNLFGKPIWITEFAVADWNSTDETPTKYTEQEVIDFMNNVIPRLEKLSFVERYAWKTRNTSDKYMKTSAIFEDSGDLTTVGKLYASFGKEETITSSPTLGSVQKTSDKSSDTYVQTNVNTGSDSIFNRNGTDSSNGKYYYLSAIVLIILVLLI